MTKRVHLKSPIFRATVGKEGVLQLGWDNAPDVAQMQDFAIAVGMAQGQSRIAIDRVVRKLPSPERYLREHAQGYSWAPAVLSAGKEFKAIDTGEKWRPLEHAQCYTNAAKISRESNGRIKYVEGLCIAPFGIMLHAWNVKDGKVIDRTWPLAHYNKYFGVVFSQEWLEYICLDNGGVFSRWDETFRYLHRASR